MNSGPATSAQAITPNNIATFGPTRGIYIGAPGDVKVTMFDGSEVAFTGLAVGVIHPISVTRVYVTGTTATGIIGVY